MAAAVAELKAGAGNGSRTVLETRTSPVPGKVRDPRGGMHGYATNVIVSDLDLAGMQAAAHFDPKGS